LRILRNDNDPSFRPSQGSDQDRDRDRVRVLCGLAPGFAQSDLGRQIDRLAIIGEAKWEAGMANFCKSFFKAKVRYFDHSAIDAARKWISEE
jgi:hypothetical protein